MFVLFFSVRPFSEYGSDFNVHAPKYDAEFLLITILLIERFSKCQIVVANQCVHTGTWTRGFVTLFWVGFKG